MNIHPILKHVSKAKGALGCASISPIDSLRHMTIQPPPLCRPSFDSKTSKPSRCVPTQYTSCSVPVSGDGTIVAYIRFKLKHGDCLISYCSPAAHLHVEFPDSRNETKGFLIPTLSSQRAPESALHGCSLLDMTCFLGRPHSYLADLFLLGSLR